MNNQTILLFDGVCNLCNGLVKFIIKIDKHNKIKFAPLQSKIGAEILAQHNLINNSINSLVYVKDDCSFIKSDGALELLKDIGGFWRVLAIIFKIFPSFIRNFFYDFIAKNRYRFWGKKETCIIPTENLKSKFLP